MVRCSISGASVLLYPKVLDNYRGSRNNEFPKNLTKKDLDLVELVGFDPQRFDQNRDLLAKRMMSFMFKNRIRPSQKFLEFCLGS